MNEGIEGEVGFCDLVVEPTKIGGKEAFRRDGLGATEKKESGFEKLDEILTAHHAFEKFFAGGLHVLHVFDFGGIRLASEEGSSEARELGYGDCLVGLQARRELRGADFFDGEGGPMTFEG